MPDLDINFQFSSNSQTVETTAREIQSTLDGFARAVIDEVALATVKNNYQAARRAFVSNVKQVVLAEIARMAALIGHTLALPANRTGPEGSMAIKGGMSETAELLGLRTSYNREDTGIVWPKRSKDYLKKKKARNWPSDWWEATGSLAKELSKESLYTRYFGPIRVTFTPPRATRGVGGRFARQTGGLGAGARITRSGQQGFYTDYEVGRLEVSVFGKITPTMLPSLAQMQDNEAVMSEAIPLSGVGISGLLPATKSKRIQQKLLNRQRLQRYTLEPFVSFYLTRAIPNAIWRRTEQLVGSSAARASSGGARTSLGAQFEGT